MLYTDHPQNNKPSPDEYAAFADFHAVTIPTTPISSYPRTALRIEVGRDEQHHKSAYFCVSTLQTQQTRSEQNNLEVMSLEYLLSLFTIKCIQLSV